MYDLAYHSKGSFTLALNTLADDELTKLVTWFNDDRKRDNGGAGDWSV
jgi:hypothetical protein